MDPTCRLQALPGQHSLAAGTALPLGLTELHRRDEDELGPGQACTGSFDGRGGESSFQSFQILTQRPES